VGLLDHEGGQHLGKERPVSQGDDGKGAREYVTGQYDLLVAAAGLLGRRAGFLPGFDDFHAVFVIRHGSLISCRPVRSKCRYRLSLPGWLMIDYILAGFSRGSSES
jgi:hypothetical protein